jgi:hypothetical protein
MPCLTKNTTTKSSVRGIAVLRISVFTEINKDGITVSFVGKKVCNINFVWTCVHYRKKWRQSGEIVHVTSDYSSP